MLNKHKKLLIVAFLCSMAFVPLGLLGPVFIGRAIDGIIGKNQVDFTVVFQNLVWLGLCSAAGGLLQWATLSLSRRLSATTTTDMRNRAFASVNAAPLSRIDKHAHGDIVSRLVNDADALAEGLLQAISQLVPGIVTIITTIVLMFTLNVPIALMVTLVTPLSALFARFIARRTSKLFRAQSAAQGTVSAHVNETVQGQALIRAFGYEEGITQTFEEKNKKYFDIYTKATFYSSIGNPGTRFVNSVVYAAVGVFGAILAIGGGITVGGLSAFLTYANQYTRPFNEVSAVTTQMQAAFAAAERLFEVIDWAPELPDKTNAMAPSHCNGNILANNIFFSYNTGKPLIEDISFEAKSGQRIALVGPTGCGKTTMINLLMRFYELNSGKILVDGVDVRKIKRNKLRGLYGMVLQDSWLKHATVRANIAYGKPHATDDEVRAAAESANVHRLIMRMPNGYNTVLESGGEGLSAGQKQLLCIARIMLAKPDMLILDEATSNIDTRTELRIQKALEELMHGRTSFIVAHRLSTIEQADMILVMDAGAIVERGTHRELLKLGGFYSELYHSQFETS